MKAIQTRYLGATSTRASRITAWTEGGNRVTIPYPHDLSGEEVHRAAAEALCVKMDWPTDLVGGGLPNGDWAFCFAPLTPAED